MADWHPGQILFTGFEGTRVPTDLGELIGQGRIGGVVLFARNLRDPEQVQNLVAELHERASAAAPLTVAIDQEGGRVQRLRAPWTEWPPMRRLGERGSIDDTRAVARALGRELADLRVDLNFAPVVDVDTNPENPVIGDRSFSRSAPDVGRHAAAFVEAIQSQGVAGCAKHFPGHGDTTVDSHFELPRIDHDLERLRAIELPPFRAAVEAGVASVMMAHVLIPHLNREFPATFSREALALLRGEVGFTGLVFADDFEMAAVADHFPPEVGTRAALEAGVDALLVCKRSDLRDRVLAALESSEAAQLEPALERIAAFKRNYSGGKVAQGGSPPYPEHRQLAERLR